MATWVLTPTEPNPLTGFANPLVGWQLTLASAMDALTGMMTIFAAGWVPQLVILATSAPTDPIFQLLITKGVVQLPINDTDWLVFDGINAWAIPEATVQANYTVAQQQPAPAPTPEPSNDSGGS